MKSLHLFGRYLFFCLLVTACQLQKDLEIELPSAPKQLMAEAYLIPGDSVRLLLTETTDYLDSIHLPLVNNARVIIKSATVTDTLVNHISFNSKDESISNYLSKRIFPRINEEYELLIEDYNGRKVTASTKVLPVVPIDTIQVSYNEEEKANLSVRFYDDPQSEDYYRVLFYTDNKFHADVLMEDKLTNGTYMAAHTGYMYSTKGYVEVRLYHLTPTHYKFLKSLENAEKANANNPFSQPTKIVSGVDGGIGIFAGLSYSEGMVTIK